MSYPFIFNSRDEGCKTPFGALATGQPLTLTLRIPLHYGCKTPYLFLQADGGEARQLALTSAGTQEDTELFTITTTVEEPGLYFYWFDLWVNYRKLYRGEKGTAFETTESGPLYQLTVYDSAFTAPADTAGGVMYQIFPDRFYEGMPQKPLVYNERIYRADKTKQPYFWPTNMDDGYLTLDFFGGDLAGIQQKLPYLADLGVSWIYLNPIFEAHSNHRYNTADYLNVDPYLGTNQDFELLCEEAKKLGIRIILDGVFSHTGSDSLYFNREGRYPTYGAWQGPDSRYRPWYRFNQNGTYESWWGFDTLPACDKQNRDFRNFICDEGGVIDTWLRRGASGFRLDVADELPDDFIAEIRTAVKRRGNENLLIGEVWEDATTKEAYGVRRRYFLGQELDGVMNYPFGNAILQFVKDSNAELFAETVTEICENYPPPALNSCTTHLSTHDTARAITVLAGEELHGQNRDWQSSHFLTPEQYELGIRRLVLATALQFALPGIPCVYYGDEVGMQGYKDPFNRGFYNWQSHEERLKPAIKALAGLRHICPAFAQGKLRVIKAEKGVLIFQRFAGDAWATFAFNTTVHAVAVQLAEETLYLGSLGFAFVSSHVPLFSFRA